MRTLGKVERFNNPKGFGFIEQPGSSPIFVHYSAIQGTESRSLDAGEIVTFDVGEGPKGPRAENVMRLAALYEDATPTSATEAEHIHEVILEIFLVSAEEALASKAFVDADEYSHAILVLYPGHERALAIAREAAEGNR